MTNYISEWIDEEEGLKLLATITSTNLLVNGSPAIIYATKKGHTRVVEALLAKGSDVNIQNKEGDTALMLAAKQGYKSIVEILLAKGANHSILNKHEETALGYAVYKDHKDIVDILLTKGANPNIGKIFKHSILIEAVKRSNKDIVKALLNNGADPNVHTYGWTPLFWTAYHGCYIDIEIAENLLMKGANPNIQNDRGWTPLYWAAGIGDKNMVDLLLEKGININLNLQTYMGCNTALIDAVLNKRKDIVEALLDKGADPNILNEDSCTALMLAAEKGYKDVISILLIKGKDIKVYTRNNLLGNILIKVTQKAINNRDINLINKFLASYALLHEYKEERNIRLRKIARFFSAISIGILLTLLLLHIPTIYYIYILIIGGISLWLSVAYRAFNLFTMKKYIDRGIKILNPHLQT